MPRETRPSSTQYQDHDMLSAGEVALLFRVDPKTVARWAAAGRIAHVRTPGGHTRYRYGTLKVLLEETS